MATKKTTEVTTVTIPTIDVQAAIIKVVGDSPLIMHAWSDKAKKMILDKHMKKAKTKAHDAKNPVEDFINSMYWLDGKPTEYTEEAFNEAIQNGARFGFPSVSIKAAAVAAAYRAGIAKNMVSMNGAFHINGEFIEIEGTPHIREDICRIPLSGADVRFRGQFDQWSTTFSVRYNTGMLTLEQLCNMFNLGGFSCGLGEWRPEKGGTFGMFHVE